MSGRHRMVLGRYQDVRDGAARAASANSAFASGDCDARERHNRMVNAAVERVRRRLGNKCARVARAYFNCKPWEKAGLPERTFYHALKKVRIFLGADKHWVKSRSRRTVKRTKWQ